MRRFDRASASAGWKLGATLGATEFSTYCKLLPFNGLEFSSFCFGSIARGGLTEQEEAQLWASLYLNTGQVTSILRHVESHALHPQIYPMILFAAHTGARCSEILRSRIEDFDFGSRIIRIREKKRTQKKAVTFRHVPMTQLVDKVFTKWFADHPGGQHTIVDEAAQPHTQEQARHHFNQTMLRSKWEKVRGYHVFRHSFASNLAAGGVDQRIIDEWMGHQTEEMRKRYRHLFPEQQRAAIDSVFGGVTA